MNVSQNNIDQVNAVLSIQVKKADYTEKVEKSLKDYRKKANMPGFRPGTVPLGLIKKMYGKAILAEEINKLVSESLYDHIQKNNIPVLGEPLPSENAPVPNFDTQEDFDFSFDIALAPEINLNLTTKNKVTLYNIAVSDEMVAKQVDAYKGRFGKHAPADKVEEKDVVKGELVELLPNGDINENGIKVENALLSPAYMKDKKEQAKVIGLALESQFRFNPAKAFESETEIASLLQVSKEIAADCKADFLFTIKDITRYVEAQMNQDLFDAALGKDVVSSEAEFIDKIKESLKAQFAVDSEFKLSIDMKELVVKQLEGLAFPDVFLKRWLKVSNENLTEDAIEQEYPKMIEDLKWQLAKDKVAKENELKLEKEDVEAVAKQAAKAQFAQYGMMNVPDDVLDGYVKDMLKNKDAAKNITERAVEQKTIDALKTKVTIVSKEISFEDFNKLFEN